MGRVGRKGCKCYKITDVAMKIYNGSKYFFATDSSVVCEVQNIGLWQNLAERVEVGFVVKL